MLNGIENKIQYNQKEIDMQKKFKKYYMNKINHYKKSNYHGQFLAKMSSDYLKKNFS